VNKKAKLGDAFKNALHNEKCKRERYTINMNSETRYSDDYFKNNKQINFEQMIFLFGGEDVTEYFRNNKPISSLLTHSKSSISIIVQIPLTTKFFSKTYYNKE